jgi:predicted nucleic acid-binding protein
VIVVDTNIVCYRWIPGPHSHDVDKVLAKDPDWVAPLLWRSEFRNALAGAIRRRSISVESAIEIANLAEAALAENEFSISASAVLQLVSQSGCSAYDCEFVALAREQKVPLVTADRRILRDFPKLTISLEEFVRR